MQDGWEHFSSRVGVANNVADATGEVGSSEETATVNVDAH